MAIFSKFFNKKGQSKPSESESQFERYTLFWMIFTPEMILPIPSRKSDLSYPIHEAQHFPIYICGKELVEFEKDGTFSFNPINLIAGALLGCRYRPHVPIDDVRPFLSQYLERCSIELNDGKLDELVIQIAGILRTDMAVSSQ